MDEMTEAKKYLSGFKEVKDELPCVILIQGKQVRLPSGKTAWKSKGAARSAFTNCLYSIVKYPALVRKELEKEGFVEFKVFS